MPLRYVKPLSDKQWEQVTRELKAGPTEKTIKTVTEAIARANKLKEVPPYDC